MSTESLHILLVDDNPADRALAIRELEQALGNVRIHEIRTAQELREALSQRDFNLAITDYQLNWSDGLKVFDEIKAACPDCPVIMFTGSGNEELAVEGLKRGLEEIG